MDYFQFKKYIMHAGIPGMEAGVRHGPPYPIDDATRNAMAREAAEKYKKINKEAKFKKSPLGYFLGSHADKTIQKYKAEEIYDDDKIINSKISNKYFKKVHDTERLSLKELKQIYPELVNLSKQYANQYINKVMNDKNLSSEAKEYIAKEITEETRSDLLDVIYDNNDAVHFYAYYNDKLPKWLT